MTQTQPDPLGDIAAMQAKAGQIQVTPATGGALGGVVAPHGLTETGGVPLPGHNAPVKLQWTAYGTQARTDPTTMFTDDNRWDPLSDPQSIPGLQLGLVQAGLVNQKSMTLGRWDSKMAAAYGNVLAFANATGMSPSDALGYLVSNNAETTKTRQIKLDNPADIEAAYQAVAEKLLGHDLPEGEASTFARGYIAQEKEVAASTAATVTNPPNVSVAAQNEIQQKYGTETAAVGLAGRMSEFFSMLRAPVQVQNPK